MNNNGVNDTNQTIPGVKIAPPSDGPVDATTKDVGAAVSKAVQINTENSASNIAGGNAVNNDILNSSVQIAETISPTTIVDSVNQSLPSQNVQVLSNESLPSPSTSDEAEFKNKSVKQKKPKNKVARFFFFIILLLIGGCFYLWNYHEQQMAIMRNKCTPVSTNGDTKKLDLDSTIVKDLYSKVSTNLREDLGQSELNDELKIYLAYRQIPSSMFYDSHCG